MGRTKPKGRSQGKKIRDGGLNVFDAQSINRQFAAPHGVAARQGDEYAQRNIKHKSLNPKSSTLSKFCRECSGVAIPSAASLPRGGQVRSKDARVHKSCSKQE